MIEIGRLDRITAVIGERGMGKSTLLKMDTRAFQRETGGYVIGHSPNGQIGHEKDITFYDRMDGFRGLERGLFRHPERIHILTQGPVEQMFGFTERLSLAIRKRAWNARRDELDRHGWEGVSWSQKRFNPARPALNGTMAPPVLLLVDEGTSMKRHPSNEQIESLERFLVNARHRHVAFTWSIQSPTNRQWVILEQANRFRIFRYTHQYGATGLMAAGIPKDVAYTVHDLPAFSYYRHDKGPEGLCKYEILPDPKS